MNLETVQKIKIASPAVGESSNVSAVKAIEVKDLSKVYGSKANQTLVLDSISLDIEQGAFCIILGRSGSGKSTLLNLMAGLDKASKGSVIVNGLNLTKLGQGAMSKYRGSIGIIFQSYSLLPNLNALENIMMGVWASGQKTPKGGQDLEAKAKELMEKFGLGQRIKARVDTLSGGEKQRVAIIRAIIGGTKVLFCDEPTGALDTKNEAQVMNMLKELNQEGVTIICVTHNPEFKALATQVVDMSDGKITSIEKI
jgi:putative ABC transport system ATP-binding protein